MQQITHTKRELNVSCLHYFNMFCLFFKDASMNLTIKFFRSKSNADVHWSKLIDSTLKSNEMLKTCNFQHPS